MHRILGIDPGTLCVGYAVLEYRAGVRGLQYVECGVIRPPKAHSVPARIVEIAGALTEVIDEFTPDTLALEMAFHGKNAASALKLGQARGAIMLLGAQHGLDIHEYAPSTIKQQVVGHGRATKAQVQARVQLLLALQRTPSSDAADALAIALCHAQLHPRPRLRVVASTSSADPKKSAAE